jgi:hypothetical protein
MAGKSNRFVPARGPCAEWPAVKPRAMTDLRLDYRVLAGAPQTGTAESLDEPRPEDLRAGA